MHEIVAKVRSSRLLSGLVLLFLLAGVGITVFVAQQNQDNRQRATGLVSPGMTLSATSGNPGQTATVAWNIPASPTTNPSISPTPVLGPQCRTL